MRRTIALVGLATTLVGSAAPVAAQTAYTSRASFLAALSSSSVVDFAGIAPANFFADVGIPYTIGGLTLNTANDPNLTQFLVIDGGYAGGAFSLGSGATFSPQIFGGVNDLLVTTAGGFWAFGFDYGGPTGTSFAVSLDGTPFQTVTYSQTLPTAQFFGFISATPVTTVSIRASTDTPIYDNLTTGTPSVATAPEPLTTALLGTGLLLVGGIARRRRPVSTASTRPASPA